MLRFPVPDAIGTGFNEGKLWLIRKVRTLQLAKSQVLINI